MVERSVDKLRKAMALQHELALAGGDVDLTWGGICKLASVPRSTASRAKIEIHEWKRLQGEIRLALTKAAIVDGNEEAKMAGELERALRQTIDIMANQIQALSLAVVKQEEELVRLRKLEDTNVISIR